MPKIHPVAAVSDSLRKMVTSAAQNTDKIAQTASLKRTMAGQKVAPATPVAARQQMSTPSAGGVKQAAPPATVAPPVTPPSEGAPQLAAGSSVAQGAEDPEHPFAGLSPEQLQQYETTQKNLVGILNQNKVDPAQIQQAYQPAIDEVQSQPVPSTPSAGRAFFAALGSPEHAPGLLQDATNHALSVQQEKSNHLLSLKEAITHATIQQQLQEGQTKQAMESTLKLDELHRAQELADIKDKYKQQIALAGFRDRAAERRQQTDLASRYSIADDNNLRAIIDTARTAAERSNPITGLASTPEEVENAVTAAVQSFANRHGPKVVAPPPPPPPKVAAVVAEGNNPFWSTMKNSSDPSKKKKWAATFNPDGTRKTK